MAGEELSWEQLKQKTYFGRPHVVILGAGASLAALPEGDPSGAVLPVMNNLADVLELTNVIEQNGLKCHGRNFEDVYFEVAENSKLAGLKELIIPRIHATSNPKSQYSPVWLSETKEEAQIRIYLVKCFSFLIQVIMKSYICIPV